MQGATERERERTGEATTKSLQQHTVAILALGISRMPLLTEIEALAPDLFKLLAAIGASAKRVRALQ